MQILIPIFWHFFYKANGVVLSNSDCPISTGLDENKKYVGMIPMLSGVTSW